MNIPRRTFLASAGAMLLGGLTHPRPVFPRPSIPARQRPNILFINADDYAQWAMGAYGNRDIHTPNMDLLAAEGVRFTRAFTCPVCSPSRAMTMTGCYNHQLGIDDWISPAEPFGLPANVPTIAERLQEAGYRTALVGKWHLGHSRQDYYPDRRGFDYFAGFLGGSQKTWDPDILENGMTYHKKGGLTDVLADYATEFLQTYRREPFALFFHPFRPHAPYVPVPEEDSAHYENRDLNVPEVEGVERSRILDITRKYYSAVSSVDRNIGKILETLGELGQLDNTMIVCTGDNGYNIGQHGLWHKGNANILATGRTRSNMFDTSAMVPLLVRWPGVTPAGAVCDRLVSSLDHFPTLLEAAGIQRKPGDLTEGMSMLPLIRGEETPWRDRLFLCYNQHHYQPNARMRMLRTESWKLVHHYEPDTPHELYDLEKDPRETVNRIDDPSCREIRESLHRELVLWEKRTGAEG